MVDADEVRTVDFYPAKLLKQLVNREQCERAMSSPDMEQGRWKGIAQRPHRRLRLRLRLRR